MLFLRKNVLDQNEKDGVLVEADRRLCKSLLPPEIGRRLVLVESRPFAMAPVELLSAYTDDDRPNESTWGRADKFVNGREAVADTRPDLTRARPPVVARALELR